ncbi:MAG: two component transcriptional regulator, LytTR family [Bacteroidetes bacterium]|nr:two component transcriptional regulator, LytTR family [Bacteroidota bacterium]
MNARYVVIDDEKGSRDVLTGFLNKYCPEIRPAGEAETVDSAYKLITSLNPDLIFLDISMPDYDGFALLEKFGKVDFEVIFVTAYEEHARRAIKSNAVDYLLKPIGIVELKDAVGRAIQRIRDKKMLADSRELIGKGPLPAKPEKITVPVKDGFIYVNIADIIRCEADGGYTWLHFENREKVLVTKTLKEFEDLFLHDQFARVHHRHLISLKFVAKYNHGRGGQVIMTDGVAIEVSQRKRSEFLQRIGIKE